MKTRFPLALSTLLVLGLAAPAAGHAQTMTNMSRTIVDKDFTTPWAAVETMIRAAKAEDVETLALCFHRRTEEAFVPYRDATATPRQLDALSEWAWDAHVIEVEMDGSRDAIVHVRFPPEDRPWPMKVVRTSDGWKVSGR